MKNIRRWLCVISAFVICKTSNIYAATKNMSGGNSVYDQMSEDNSMFYQQIENAVSMGGTEISQGNGLYAFYKGVVSCIPFILLFSVCIGALLLAICRKNKGIQRFALFVLILGVPIVCLVFVFGFGFLCGMFN